MDFYSAMMSQLVYAYRVVHVNHVDFYLMMSFAGRFPVSTYIVYSEG